MIKKKTLLQIPPSILHEGVHGFEQVLRGSHHALASIQKLASGAGQKLAANAYDLHQNPPKRILKNLFWGNAGIVIFLGGGVGGGGGGGEGLKRIVDMLQTTLAQCFPKSRRASRSPSEARLCRGLCAKQPSWDSQPRGLNEPQKPFGFRVLWSMSIHRHVPQNGFYEHRE